MNIQQFRNLISVDKTVNYQYSDIFISQWLKTAENFQLKPS